MRKPLALMVVPCMIVAIGSGLVARELLQHGSHDGAAATRTSTSPSPAPPASLPPVPVTTPEAPLSSAAAAIASNVGQGASPPARSHNPCSGATCHLLPDALVIPEIGVNAFVEMLGQTRDGDVAVPTEWQDAGWFDRGYYPGTPGNAAILGHLDTPDPAHREGVFWNLHRLHPGSRVTVIRADGSALNFVVSSVTTYALAGFPLSTVFGPSDHPVLRLLTCAGRFRGTGPGYDSRTVVTAVPA